MFKTIWDIERIEMDELIKLVAKKTGLPPDKAKNEITTQYRWTARYITRW
jgi:hypothetical protein